MRETTKRRGSDRPKNLCPGCGKRKPRRRIDLERAWFICQVCEAPHVVTS